MELTIDQAIERLRVYIAVNHNGKQKGLADEIGVSTAFISSIMTKKKMPSRQILNLIGIESKKKTIHTFKIKEA